MAVFRNIFSGEVLFDTEEEWIAYEKGRKDERRRILGTVNWKRTENLPERTIEFSISYNDALNAKQVGEIIEQQIKEKQKSSRRKSSKRI